MEKQDFPILEIKKGLLETHQSQTPLFERVEFGARDKCVATRTYKDGSHYVIANDPFDPEEKRTELSWTKLVTVSEEGISILKKIIEEEAITSKDSIGVSPLNPNKIYWNFFLDKGNVTIITGGGDYNSLPPFVKKLDLSINKNIVSPK